MEEESSEMSKIMEGFNSKTGSIFISLVKVSNFGFLLPTSGSFSFPRMVQNQLGKLLVSDCIYFSMTERLSEVTCYT